MIQTFSHPSDERQELAGHKAASTTLLGLFVLYLIIGAVFGFRGVRIPLSTQLLMIGGFCAYLIQVIRSDGTLFRIPWIPETDETSNRPALWRAIPALIVLQGVIKFLFDNLFRNILDYSRGVIGLDILLLGVVTAVFVLSGVIYIAHQVKFGNRMWITFTGISSLIGLIICAVLSVSFYLLPPTESFYDKPFVANIILQGLLFGFIVVGMLRYGKQMWNTRDFDQLRRIDIGGTFLPKEMVDQLPAFTNREHVKEFKRRYPEQAKRLNRQLLTGAIIFLSIIYIPVIWHIIATGSLF